DASRGRNASLIPNLNPYSLLLCTAMTQPYQPPYPSGSPGPGKPWWVWLLVGCGALAVMGIGGIAILGAILFPVFAQAREKARATVCITHERRLAEALLQYTQDYDGHGPSAGAWCDQLLPGLGDEKPFACPTAHS